MSNYTFPGEAFFRREYWSDRQSPFTSTRTLQIWVMKTNLEIKRFRTLNIFVWGNEQPCLTVWYVLCSWTPLLSPASERMLLPAPASTSTVEQSFLCWGILRLFPPFITVSSFVFSLLATFSRMMSPYNLEKYWYIITTHTKNIYCILTQGCHEYSNYSNYSNNKLWIMGICIRFGPFSKSK